MISALQLFDATTIWAFCLATAAVYLAPGPDMAFIASNAMRHGLGAAVAAAGGAVTGVWCQALASAFGVTALFAASPMAFEVVRWAGVAYLIYLGVSLLMAQDRAASPGEAKTVNRPRIWMQGIGINLLNPKISIFFISFLPQFVDPAKGAVFAQLLLLAVAFSLGAILWVMFLAFVFTRLGDRLGRNAVALAWQRRVTAVVLIVFGGILAGDGLRRAGQ